MVYQRLGSGSTTRVGGPRLTAAHTDRKPVVGEVAFLTTPSLDRAASSFQPTSRVRVSVGSDNSSSVAAAERSVSILVFAIRRSCGSHSAPPPHEAASRAR